MLLQFWCVVQPRRLFRLRSKNAGENAGELTSSVDFSIHTALLASQLNNNRFTGTLPSGWVSEKVGLLCCVFWPHITKESFHFQPSASRCWLESAASIHAFGKQSTDWPSLTGGLDAAWRPAQLSAVGRVW